MGNPVLTFTVKIWEGGRNQEFSRHEKVCLGYNELQVHYIQKTLRLGLGLAWCPDKTKQQIEFKYCITANVGGPKWISLLWLWTRTHPIALGGGRDWLLIWGWVWPDVGAALIWCSPSDRLCSQGRAVCWSRGRLKQPEAACSPNFLYLVVSAVTEVESLTLESSDFKHLVAVPPPPQHVIQSLQLTFILWIHRAVIQGCWVPESDTILQVLSPPAPGRDSLCFRNHLDFFLYLGRNGGWVGLVSLLLWKLCWHRLLCPD